ncbi:melatonin receptor type 1C-like [Oculina patagonica]
MEISTTSLVYVLCLTAMMIFNIAGNSLVCLMMLKKKAMKTSINWLLFHLAIADLLVAVFFIPPCILIHVIEQPSGFVGDMLCKFITSGTLGWVAASASSFLLVVIAFERYKATLHPLEQLSRDRSSWLLPTAWIIAILLSMPCFLASTYDIDSRGCVKQYQGTMDQLYRYTWAIANSLLPICIMGYLYTRIILCLRNRVHVPSSSPMSVSQSRNKVTKMLISVSAIFIACWTPPTLLCVLTTVTPFSGSTVSNVSAASALLNSCLNPLVYTLHSQNFRKNLASLVSCSKRK